MKVLELEARASAVADICEFISKIESGDCSIPMTDPETYGAFRPIVEKLNELARSQVASQEPLEAMLKTVSEMTALNFGTQLERSPDVRVIDALAAGVNMLAEEFQHSMVSRAELEKTEGEFRSIFEQNAAGIVFVSPEGIVLKCNERYAKFYQAAPGAMLGLRVRDLIGSEDRGFAEASMEKILSGELNSFSTERRLVQADRAIMWCLLNFCAVRDGNGKLLYLVSILQDISEARHLQATLMTSSRLTALGEMAGGVAHEINNPLGIIQGKSTQLLRRIRTGNFTTQGAQDELEKIVATSERITKIVSGLRSFSRNGESDPIASVTLKVVADNVLSLCSERFRAHDVKIELGAVPDLVFDARAVQIEQVLLNLLTNAFDAVEKFVEKWVRIEFLILDDQLQISVTDSGRGISALVAESLMQPFFTTKEVGKGTGLGLSISKGIAEDHGGKLYLDKGALNTRFVLELPIRHPSKMRKVA